MLKSLLRERILPKATIRVNLIMFFRITMSIISIIITVTIIIIVIPSIVIIMIF